MKVIKYDNIKAISKALRNKKSSLVRNITELILKGYSERDYCKKLGINYRLYRYYLHKYNNKLKEQLSVVRTMRRAYQHEHTMRRELYKVRCKDAYKYRREKSLWYKLL